MRLMLSLILTLVAGPVFAQAQQAASPREIASARAQADRLIQDAGAQAWFENVTDSGLPAVRHRPSGMRCLFAGNASDRIVVFPTGHGGIPQGDDIGCVVRDEGLATDLTLYATRYRPLPSEAQVLQDAVSAIRQRVPDARPYRGDVASASTGDGDPPLQAAFEIMTPQGPMLTIALVQHVGEWGYKARITGPQGDASGVSLYGTVMFAGALLDIDD